MFHFVHVNHPEEGKEQRQRRAIKQHAIRIGLQRKRREDAQRHQNFVPVHIDHRTGKPMTKTEKECAAVMVKAVSPSRLDPFDCLPGNGERLRMLMRQKSAKRAGEPVFCVEDAGKIFFQGLDTLFKGALSDPALFHALSLVLASAANDYVSNVECLQHRGAMLRNLRERMSDRALVPQVSTLTAMLLLVGYEYRVQGSNSNSIAIHLRAINDVMNMSRAANVAISDAIGRALFWQDLYSCLFVGTSRLLSHKDYAGVHCIRDPELSLPYYIPAGFRSVVSNFKPKFSVVLEELSALCAFVDAAYGPSAVPVHRCPADDFQASIESQIVDLVSDSRSTQAEDYIYQACLFAAFLCTYKLSTGIWEGCFIPEFCATQVLGLLAKTKHNSMWNTYKELLLWLLFLSGALAERHPIRRRAMAMIRNLFSCELEGMHEDWNKLSTTLKTFTWSQHLMERRYLLFYDELHPMQLDIAASSALSHCSETSIQCAVRFFEMNSR